MYNLVLWNNFLKKNKKKRHRVIFFFYTIPLRLSSTFYSISKNFPPKTLNVKIFIAFSIADSQVVKSSAVFGSNFGGSPWEEEFHWHSISHSVRSLAALCFLLQAAREAHFLGKKLFLENMVTPKFLIIAILGAVLTMTFQPPTHLNGFKKKLFVLILYSFDFPSIFF